MTSLRAARANGTPPPERLPGRGATTNKCARCGCKLTADTSVYSRWTKARYCSDLNACDARSARQLRRSLKEFARRRATADGTLGPSAAPWPTPTLAPPDAAGGATSPLGVPA